jgi:WD40 repeat protein
MLHDTFKNAEDEFFRLKGRVAAGRITKDQFAAALKGLMIEHQGQYWMIGVNTAKWYVCEDGKNWIEKAPPIAKGTAEPVASQAKPLAPTVNLGREIRRFQGHDAEVTCVACSPDGHYALSGDGKGSVRLWDIETGSQVRSSNGHIWVNSVSFSPQGRYALAGGMDNKIYLWEVATWREIRRIVGSGRDVKSVAFFPDGARVAYGCDDGTIRVLEIESGREVVRMQGHTMDVVSVAISPDGKMVLSGSDDGTCRLWDSESGHELHTLALDRFMFVQYLVVGVAFSPDGRSILCSAAPGLQVVDSKSGQAIRRFAGMGFHTGIIHSAVLSPDGHYLLTAAGSDENPADVKSQFGLDNTVRLWDLKTAAELARLEGHGGNVNDVACLSDGKRVLSCSRDKTVRLWALPQ